MTKLLKIFFISFILSIIIFACLIYFLDNSPNTPENNKKSEKFNLTNNITNSDKTNETQLNIIITNIIIAKNFLKQYYHYPQK